MRLLIVGDLGGQLGTASKIAMSRGASVTAVEDNEAALVQLRAGKGADLAMIDVRCDIAGLVNSLESERFNLPVVACGIASDAQAAVRAIKAGAKEYLPLPPDAELIAAVLEAVTQQSKAMIYQGPSMQNVLRMAKQVAPSQASILITGESGTGKEVMARFIHDNSPRKGKAFVSVNCAAIPENLLESELFGHEKGSFTGAVARRIGKFEEANGGTLLLDEISEMDIRLQAKLLRAIQEKEIDRVGGTKPVKVDIRILATTNRILSDEVKKGTFREDLMFRLNVMNLKLPPLRERIEDIPILCDHFLKKYAEVNGVAYRPLAPRTLELLKAYPWPGNVRELENTMHRAVLLAYGDVIDPSAILLPDGSSIEAVAGGVMPAPMPTRPVASSAEPQNTTGQNIDHVVHDLGAEVNLVGLVGRTVADVERDLIIDTLKHCLGNRTHAANILGISIRTLRNKLKQYTDEGVPVPLPAGGDSAVA